MNIQLTPQKQIQLNFDTYGNLYAHQPNENTMAYQFCISNKNEPYLEYSDYQIISKYENHIETFTVLDKENSLKMKTKSIIETEMDSSEEEINYYPEEDDHLNNGYYDIDSDEISLDDKFYFWNSSFPSTDNHWVYNREDGDIMALYDVYIYGEHGGLIFKSNSMDNSSIYVLRLYHDGIICFRPVGYEETKYKIILETNDTINLIKLN